MILPSSDPSRSTGAPPPDHEFVLTLSCPDTYGIVHAVSGMLAGRVCSIVESQQFGDPQTDRFFMRVQFRGMAGAVDSEGVRLDMTALAQRFSMTWALRDVAVRHRMLLLVSRYGHCLNDLLYRAGSGALDVEIPAIVSNHPDFAGLAEVYGVAFHHLPITAGDPDSKAAAEAALLRIVDAESVDLVVLARYMQVLSPGLCAALEGRAINIHHSFLPGFKGARPYHQAHDRGVKLIGATAHYVTADLDEGPIIEQEVTRVDHAMGPDRLAAAGRDVECRALARAVQWHTEDRILLNGHRTVVFR